MSWGQNVMDWLGGVAHEAQKHKMGVTFTGGAGVTYDKPAYEAKQRKIAQEAANLKKTNEDIRIKAIENLEKYGKPASVKVTPDTRAESETQVGAGYKAPTTGMEVIPGTAGTGNQDGYTTIAAAEKLGTIYPTPKKGSRQVHIKGYGTRWVVPYPKEKEPKEPKEPKDPLEVNSKKIKNITDIETSVNLSPDVHKLPNGTEFVDEITGLSFKMIEGIARLQGYGK